MATSLGKPSRVLHVALGCVVVLSSLLALAPRAAADPKRDAQKHLTAGDRLLLQGDKMRAKGQEQEAVAAYEQAITEYEAAYETFPSAKIYFPIAQAEERLGKDLDAYRHYEKILAESDDLDDDLKMQVELRRDELAGRLAVVTFQVEPEGAQVSVDGTAIGNAPLDAPVVLMPGDHQITVTLEGYTPYERAATLEAGERPTEDVALKKIVKKVVRRPLPPPPPPPPLAVKGRGTLLTGLIVTGAFTGAATVTGLMALSKHGTSTDEGTPIEDRRAAADSGRTLAKVTDIFLLGAVVAGGYTAYYYYSVYQPNRQDAARRRERMMQSPPDEATDEPEARLWWAPYATPEGGGLAVGGSF